MICMGNLCRSPMAQAVTQKLAADAGLSSHLLVDSAGTHVPTRGEPPDPRALTTLSLHGYKVGRLRSRKITQHDFQNFDLVLAMDASNLTELRKRCLIEHRHKLRLFLSFAEGLTEPEIPDPYYGNVNGFERVLSLCEAGATGLLKHVRLNYLNPVVSQRCHVGAS